MVGLQHINTVFEFLCIFKMVARIWGFRELIRLGSGWTLNTSLSVTPSFLLIWPTALHSQVFVRITTEGLGAQGISKENKLVSTEPEKQAGLQVTDTRRHT